MASNSPGPNNTEFHRSQSDTARRARASTRSSLSDKVGFFEQVFNRQRSRSRGKESGATGQPEHGVGGSNYARVSRVEVGYHGPRTDARDRSSEDPRRHRIPRASLSPVTVPDQEPRDHDQMLEPTRKKLRSRSTSRGRSMDYRSLSRERSRSKSRYDERLNDDIPYRSIHMQRAQQTDTGQTRPEFKPRALSFRVSPVKSDFDTSDVHTPLKPIFSRPVPTPSSETKSHEPLYQKPPSLPERPLRNYQRNSEPSMYSSPKVCCH